MGESTGGRGRRQMAIRIGIALLVLGVIFGFVLPRTADYGEAWTTIGGMTGLELALLGLAGLWNLVTYWPVIVLALPGLRLREAAVVNQASTAVANTVPGGGAIAFGVTYRMLHDWGFTSQSIANHAVVSGIWNQMVKFGMPVIGIAAVALTGELDSSFISLTVVGGVALLSVVVVAVVVLRAARSTERVGHWLDGVVARIRRRLGRPGKPGVARWLVQMRSQIIEVVRRSGLPLSLAAVVSHVSLYLVLLVALRAAGISASEASWAKVLVGFALVRLLSAVPITPGGVGVVELGYVGFLATGSAEGLDSQITAAVLVFRAITYVLPVVVGGGSWIVFQRAQNWRRPVDTRGTLGLDGAPAAT